MKPVDFTAVVARMLEDGKFDDYPEPLGPQGRDPSFRNPLFPGDAAYGFARNILPEKDIPQGYVDAQHTSMRDAMAIYMPADMVATHMCTYFRSDFKNSADFHALNERRKEYRLAIENDFLVDDLYNFDLETPERKSRDGSSYYTAAEMRVVHNIAEDRPDFLDSFIGYQAGMVNYLWHLNAAIETAGAQDQWRDIRFIRAQKATSNLMVMFAGSRDIMKDLFPALALTLHAVDPTHKIDPDAAMFEKAIRTGFHLGMFQSQITSVSGKDYALKCPARMTITGVTAFGQAADGGAQHMGLGSMLAMIHKMCKAPMHQASMNRALDKQGAASATQAPRIVAAHF